MHGLRDLSIIATPPAKRLSIKTFVRQSSRGLVKESSMGRLKPVKLYVSVIRMEQIISKLRLQAVF
jgi:hypothetical protein